MSFWVIQSKTINCSNCGFQKPKGMHESMQLTLKIYLMYRKFLYYV